MNLIYSIGLKKFNAVVKKNSIGIKNSLSLGKKILTDKNAFIWIGIDNFFSWVVYKIYNTIDNFLVLIKYKTSSGLVSLSYLFLSNGERLTSTVLSLLGNLAVFERFFCQLQIWVYMMILLKVWSRQRRFWGPLWWQPWWQVLHSCSSFLLLNHLK